MGKRERIHNETRKSEKRREEGSDIGRRIDGKVWVESIQGRTKREAGQEPKKDRF